MQRERFAHLGYPQFKEVMMENRIITAVFKGSKNTKVSDVWQWDYGQTLRI